MKYKLHKIATICLMLVVAQLACKKDDVVPINNDGETQNTNSKYKQYGTPYVDVPNTEDVVMYEVNLRAFSQGGDIQGLIDRLDEVKKLGVNVVWLMPIYPIGQINGVNSPYSVKDYKAVGSEYGSMEELRKLTDLAHSKGMSVILDWVANHTAWDNEWIKNPSWYSQDASGNIIHPAGTNWMDVADLNYSNGMMRDSMIDAMKFWAYEANIDGFRCDYADGVPYDFWKQAIDSIRLIPNRKFIFFAEGSRQDHFNAGFNLNFGFDFFGGLKNAFNGQSASKIITAHDNEYKNVPTGKHWVRYTTNHDESAWNATPMTLFKGIDGALAASVVAIFTGGVPLIYGSQEVGTVNKVPFFSNTVINWNANQDMLNQYESILQFYSTSDIGRKGINTNYTNDDVLCIKKSLNGKSIYVVVNIRNKDIIFSVPGAMQNKNVTNAITKEVGTLGTQLDLNPFQYLILKE